MIAWFEQYWMYAVALVVVCIIAGFIFKKAAAAYRAHQKAFHAEETKMRRLAALKEKYVPLTAEAIAAAPEDELLEGVALGIQLMLQKQPDMEKAFAALSQEQQYIYALDVFVSDQTAAVFFKENGAILVGIIAPAFALVGLTEFQTTMDKLAVMFDENDETTSINMAFVARSDAEFSESELLTKIKLQGAKYIREHPEQFL